MGCSPPSDTYQYLSYRESLAVGGPSARITDRSLTNLADIYKKSRTTYAYGTYDSGSISNASTLQGFIAKAETYTDFTQQVQVGNATIAPGAFWLGYGSSKPTFAWPARPFHFANGLMVQNALNNLLIDGRIKTSFEQFNAPRSPSAYDFPALLFVIYYSYHLPYLFASLFLYGISSSILSYLISKIARSQLAAWAFCASGQVVMCLAYFGAYLGVQSNVPIGDLTPTLNKATSPSKSHPRKSSPSSAPTAPAKSTAISLIRVDTPPSSTPHHDSSILIDTTSILSHRSAARARLGVCPQFDASDTLTVPDSLHFYARVRGVADPAHNISQCISAFGLQPYAHSLSSLQIILRDKTQTYCYDWESVGVVAG
ncbi:MAG: hypothetical protein Q9226_008556 [Calogaya cf. arnoldii]